MGFYPCTGSGWMHGVFSECTLSSTFDVFMCQKCAKNVQMCETDLKWMEYGSIIFNSDVSVVYSWQGFVFYAIALSWCFPGSFLLNHVLLAQNSFFFQIFCGFLCRLNFQCTHTKLRKQSQATSGEVKFRADSTAILFWFVLTSWQKNKHVHTRFCV